MWNFSKRSCALFVICLLVSASLLAFPGRYSEPKLEEEVIQETLIELPLVEEVEEAPIVEETPVVVVEEVEETLPVEESESSSEAISTTLLQMLSDYEQSSKLNKKELEMLIEKLETIKSEYEIICEDLEDKELQIEDLTILNGKQADDLAYLRGAYDRESGTKAFAKVGAVIGFDNLNPAWGISTSLGARFGKGFLVEVGAQYMLGTFLPGNLIYDTPTLDNLAITTSVGWEW